MAEVTLDGLRDMLASTRQRLVVFFHEDDRATVVEACRTLRAEGWEIAEKESPLVVPGQVIAANADLLQPPKFLFEPRHVDG